MIKILLKYELLALMRDTRTIFLSLILPLILVPLLLLTLNSLGDRIAGESNSTFHFARAVSEPGLEILANHVFSEDCFREVLTENSEEMLAEGHLDLVLRTSPSEQGGKKLPADLVSMFPQLAPLFEERGQGRPVVELLYRSDRERSVQAYVKASRALKAFREELLVDYLDKQDISIGVELEGEDQSTEQEKASRRYGPALSSFMVLMLLGGGSVAALDSLAGERERGTLSTLFVSSMRRRDIAWSKFYAVAIISLVVALVQILNLSLYVAFGMVKLPLSMTLSNAVVGVFNLSVLFLMEAIFTASLLLHISAQCKSFKEAQLFFFPVFLIAFALSLAGLAPGLSVRSVVSLIPLTGPGLLIPEILSGRSDLTILLLQCVVHLGAAYALFRSTLNLMESESFLGGEPSLHGEELRFDNFSRRVVPLFAFLAAALFVVPSNFEILTSLKGQGLFNQLVLFVLLPFLFLRYFKRPLGEVVPVRAVRWNIVLASLALIPLGQLAATGLSHLFGPLLPAPVKALEGMMKLLEIDSTPAWQLFILIGILPGLCEEFAFRGVLLHALHKRFPPWKLALVVAIIFGFFHINFFRVLPTAYLGFIMGLLTLATGSVIPAVIVHIGNNSFAVWAMLNHVDLESLPSWVYMIGFLGQITFVSLVMRWGKGYTGTRWQRTE